MAKKKIDKKSPYRHLITAIGVLLGLLGLDEYLPVITYLEGSFEGIYSAVILLIGAVTTVWGYLFGRETEDPQMPEEGG